MSMHRAAEAMRVTPRQGRCGIFMHPRILDFLTAAATTKPGVARNQGALPVPRAAFEGSDPRDRSGRDDLAAIVRDVQARFPMWCAGGTRSRADVLGPIRTQSA